MSKSSVTENEKVAKHTAGPWTVHEGGDVIGADGFEVAEPTAMCISPSWQDAHPGRHWGSVDASHLERSDEEVAANARLIAAAPELLEALKTTALNIRSLHGAQHGVVYEAYSVWLRIVEDAIAKAEARS